MVPVFSHGTIPGVSEKCQQNGTLFRQGTVLSLGYCLGIDGTIMWSEKGLRESQNKDVEANGLLTQFEQAIRRVGV